MSPEMKGHPVSQPRGFPGFPAPGHHLPSSPHCPQPCFWAHTAMGAHPRVLTPSRLFPWGVGVDSPSSVLLSPLAPTCSPSSSAPHSHPETTLRSGGPLGPTLSLGAPWPRLFPSLAPPRPFLRVPGLTLLCKAAGHRFLGLVRGHRGASLPTTDLRLGAPPERRVPVSAPGTTVQWAALGPHPGPLPGARSPVEQQRLPGQRLRLPRHSLAPLRTARAQPSYRPGSVFLETAGSPHVSQLCIFISMITTLSHLAGCS